MLMESKKNEKQTGGRAKTCTHENIRSKPTIEGKQNNDLAHQIWLQCGNKPRINRYLLVCSNLGHDTRYGLSTFSCIHSKGFPELILSHMSVGLRLIHNISHSMCFLVSILAEYFIFEASQSNLAIFIHNENHYVFHELEILCIEHVIHKMLQS